VVEHTLGKGEVESSILSRSTIFSNGLAAARQRGLLQPGNTSATRFRLSATNGLPALDRTITGRMATRKASSSKASASRASSRNRFSTTKGA
jgi:hypothetical protein